MTQAQQIAALTDMVNQLQARLNEVEGRSPPPSDQTNPGLTQLENRLSLIEGNYSQLSENSPNQSNQAQRQPDIKVALPDKFDGNYQNYETFIAALDNYFALKASVYTTDEIKVRTTGTFLSKQALQWWSTLIKEDSNLLKNFEGFMAELKRLFSDPNSKMKAQLLIKKLKQGNASVMFYSTKFRTIAVDTKFNKEALMAAFRSGLADPIKDNGQYS